MSAPSIALCIPRENITSSSRANADLAQLPGYSANQGTANVNVVNKPLSTAMIFAPLGEYPLLALIGVFRKVLAC